MVWYIQREHFIHDHAEAINCRIYETKHWENCRGSYHLQKKCKVLPFLLHLQLLQEPMSFRFLAFTMNTHTHTHTHREREREREESKKERKGKKKDRTEK